MSSGNWLSGLWMPEPPGNTSQLDDADRTVPWLTREVTTIVTTDGTAHRVETKTGRCLTCDKPVNEHPITIRGERVTILAVFPDSLRVRYAGIPDMLTVPLDEPDGSLICHDDVPSECSCRATVAEEDFAAEAPAPVTTPAGLPMRTPGATLDDDLDAPVPYVPVDVAVTTRPVSSQAGLPAVYRPTLLGAPISSGGAVPSTPAPSDGTNSLVELDREEAAERLADAAAALLAAPDTHHHHRQVLRGALADFRTVTR